jgi:aldehyde:ferredoxin oxidoreductase
VGADTIDVGGALGLLMEAGVIDLGDAEGALVLIREISQGTHLGRLIGSGGAITAKVYCSKRIAQMKGQALSAFDPSTVKGQGVTFATSPQWPDHTARLAYAGNLLTIGSDVDPLSSDGQIELSRSSHISAAMVDTLGLCLFISLAFLDVPAALEAMV